MIINSYDQLKAAADAGFDKTKLICISFHKRQNIFSPRWRASSPFFQLDPKAHWSDYGALSIITMGREEKALRLAEIQEIVKQRFGVDSWAKNRMGDYVPIEVNRKFPIPKRGTFSMPNSHLLTKFNDK